MCRHLQRHLYPYPPSGTDRGGGELPGPVCGPAVFPLRRLLQLAQSAPCAGPPDGVRHRRPAALRLPRPAGSWVRHGQTRRCLHGCLPSGALYLGQRSIAGTVAALSPALLLAAVVSGRAADDLPDVVGPHRAAPGPAAHRRWPSWLWAAGRPPGAGGGPEPPGAGSGQRAHPKRVAGRPALLPPGHLDGIAAGADRGPAAGLALAGGGRRGPFWRCGSAAARNSWTSMWGRCWPRCA